ncbi:MAG: type I restriction enzyme HsdR N-terminal domain-containing protein [Bacteroidia bacterium]|nr:type I restriction enzyme HsdR N-terminal domain-containing protein [Bacteroidia bacterium]
MEKLNLPTYTFKFRNNNKNKVELFDIVRKKYVVLRPEEWVRQNFIRYLNQEKGFPIGLMQLEKPLTYNSLDKRSDIVVYNKTGKAIVLVECKAPHINITQNAFDQIARYNFKLKVKYLIATNGINHFYCRMNYSAESYSFIEQIPNFGDL